MRGKVEFLKILGGDVCTQIDFYLLIYGQSSSEDQGAVAIGLIFMEII